MGLANSWNLSKDWSHNILISWYWPLLVCLGSQEVRIENSEQMSLSSRREELQGKTEVRNLLQVRIAVSKLFVKNWFLWFYLMAWDDSYPAKVLAYAHLLICSSVHLFICSSAHLLICSSAQISLSTWLFSNLSEKCSCAVFSNFAMDWRMIDPEPERDLSSGEKHDSNDMICLRRRRAQLGP
jgi:hypothetical protein